MLRKRNRKKIIWTPNLSASTPKNNGAAVVAMLTEKELTLYAVSKLFFPFTDSAIIVLVIGTVPFVRNPNTRARPIIRAEEGTRASTIKATKMEASLNMKIRICPILSTRRPMTTFPRRLPTKNTAVKDPSNVASIPRNVKRKGRKMNNEEFANESMTLAQFAQKKCLSLNNERSKVKPSPLRCERAWTFLVVEAMQMMKNTPATTP